MNYAILLSGGVGSRMQSASMPKQYLEVNGKPILRYTMVPFDKCEKVDHIVVVANEQWHEQIMQWVKDFGIHTPVSLAPNGDSRQSSVFNGVCQCAKIKTPEKGDKVLIHDGVRPMVSTRIIEDCIATLDEHTCCLTVVPDNDTTYISRDGQTVHSVANREELMLGQCPEGFDLPTFLELNENATQEELATLHGCSEIAFYHGHTVRLITGSPLNFKLTRPDDLVLFKAMLDAQQI